MKFSKKTPLAFSLVELSIAIVILGIALSGIAYSSRILREYSLGTARSITKTSDAATINGMVLWLDATADKSITNTSNSYSVSDGDNVKTWIDQNSQLNEKFVATQKAAGEGPIYKENGINGLPTMYFDYVAGSPNVGDGLNIPFSRILNPDEFTIFIVTQPIENTAYWESLVMSRDRITNVYTGFNIYKNNNNPLFEFWVGSSSTDGWTITSDSSNFAFNNPYILTCIRTGTGSSDTSMIYKNGVLGNTTSNKIFIPNNSPSEATANFRIGTSGASYFDGYISEIILYNRYLKDYERKMVESYLAKKYNIRIS